MTGRIYEISENFGVFVAVDDCYSGLIPAKEAQGKYRVGDILNLRVTRVQEDGKLDLSDKEKIPQQMEKDAEVVMKVIEEFEGVLRLTIKFHRRSSKENSDSVRMHSNVPLEDC